MSSSCAGVDEAYLAMIMVLRAISSLNVVVSTLTDVQSRFCLDLHSSTRIQRAGLLIIVTCKKCSSQETNQS